MARINSYTKITGAPADSDCFIIDSTQGTAGTRIVLWSVLKSVLTGIFAPKAHKHPGSDITSAVANANAATNDSVGQNIASTYVKEITANGRTVTVKRGNDTTFTFQTQDTNTTYPVADSQHDGLMPAGKFADLEWVHKHYFEHVRVEMHGSVPALHFTNQAAGTVASEYVDAANASHSGIMAAADWRLLHSLKTIDRPDDIPANADLNNYKTPGWYAIGWNESTTIQNIPVSGETLGTLQVMRTNNHERMQVYITALGAENRSGRETIFVRQYGDGGGSSWSPWTDITAYQSATQSADGLMSSADKRKLDGLSGDYASAIGLATSSKDGLMPKTDKAKLDAIGSISTSTIDGFFRI
jgi:hypothetical protein|nr:MAG TPA: tail fiber protein [Caudoviricetes sp.]